MNPIYRGQYPPKNTNVLWIKDNQIYIYQNGGWKATSGGTADFNAKEGEPGYIANKPLSKTVTSETTTYGSGNTYVDINKKVQPGLGGDMFGYIYSPDGGLDPSGSGRLTANELYCVRMIMPAEPGNPTIETVDIGYKGVDINSGLRMIFSLIDSWLTEDQQSGGTNYVDIYNSSIFFKPDENIKTPRDLDLAIFDIIGLDPDDPDLTDDIIRQALVEHESEVLALCDNYIYKTAGGIFVIAHGVWSDQEQANVSKAYIADPSDTYMNYWNISSGHKVVENYAVFKKVVSNVMLAPVISEVYGASPTEEQEDMFDDKVAETTLSDYDMSSIVEITTTTTEYQQLEEGYLPDNTYMILGSPRVIGTVPAELNALGKDLPIIEASFVTSVYFRQGNTNTNITLPQEVQNMVTRAVGSDFQASVLMQVDCLKISNFVVPIGSFGELSYIDTDIIPNSTIYINDSQSGNAELQISSIKYNQRNTSSLAIRINYNIDSDRQVPAFVVVKLYPDGTAWNGSM